MNSSAPQHKIQQRVIVGLRVVLVAAAIWALHRELASVSRADFIARVRTFGWPPIALALACTLGSFAILGAIELLAVRCGAGLPHRAVPATVAVLTSFIANAFGHSVGLTLLTGTAVRLRSYARYGVSVAEVARVSAVVSLTTALGLMAVGAWALIGAPSIAVVGPALRPAGIVCAILVAGYLAWSALGTRDVIGGSIWHIVRPSSQLALRQIFLSIVDWLFTATVLFLLLPASSAIAYGTLLRAYVVAQVAGVLSHVPAGAGVFEVVFLAVLTQGTASTERAGLAATLLMFRIIYYLVPLCAAVATAFAAELRTPEAIRAG